MTPTTIVLVIIATTFLVQSARAAFMTKSDDVQDTNVVFLLLGSIGIALWAIAALLGAILIELSNLSSG